MKLFTGAQILLKDQAKTDIVYIPCCFRLVHIDCFQIYKTQHSVKCSKCGTPWHQGFIDFELESIHTVLNRQALLRQIRIHPLSSSFRPIYMACVRGTRPPSHLTHLRTAGMVGHFLPFH